jgi:transcriptional regulator GlxA family with amidase domain
VEEDYGAQLVREVAPVVGGLSQGAGGQSQFSVLGEADPPPQSALRAVTAAIAANPAADHASADG